jgi:SulP family sulfate permease
MTHAVILGLTVIAAAQLVAHIPLASLAGVLIAATARMIKPSEMLAMIRRDWVDAAVLIATFVVTIFVDLITAVAVGVVITVLLSRVRLLRTPPMIDDKETLGD